jgi:DNA-3-methyladenine glycosylase II
MKAKLKRHFATKDPVVAAIVALWGQYELGKPADRSAFQSLASSIASQQISGAVARAILGRLTAMHGDRFPTPAELAAATPAQLRAVGFSFAKIAALHDLAAHCLDGRIPPDEELSKLGDEEIIERCSAVRGIGRWTVQMLLMFQFGREDVMPVDDFGVRKGFQLAYGLKGMPKPRALLAYAERWKPYRSAGAWYMWRAVELHGQGKLPKRAGRAPRIELEVSKESPAPRPPRSGGRPAAGRARRATPSSRPKRAAPRRP